MGILIDFTVQCTGQNSKIDCSCCDHCNGMGHGGIPSNTNGLLDEELNQEENAVLSKIKTLSGNLVTKYGTPQAKASYWIIKDDQANVPAKSSFLFQRYVLALLHFMMENSDTKMMEGYGALDECDWDGVECNEEGHVSSIKFGKLQNFFRNN